MESGVSVSEDYGEDQAATSSARPEPVVAVRGLVKARGVICHAVDQRRLAPR
jgi:hypothetical protein